MATAPLRSGFAETSSSRRVLGSPLWYRVGPWPAILGWTRNLYPSIRSRPVQLGGELAATEEHAGRGRVLQLLHARAQVAGDVVAVGPREVLSRRGHDVLRLCLQLDRPLAQRWRRLFVAAGDRRPVALHHLVGDAAPQHRPALVHEAGEESVCLVVGDTLPVVDATVEGDVDAEGQDSHGGASTPS